MNPRIRELLLKAGWDGYEALDERNQKFAELIVRECIACINDTDKDGIFTAQAAGIVGAAHQRSMQAIKKHWGLEE